MTITFDLLKKIAAVEEINYNFLRNLAISPVPGELYDATKVQEDKIISYLKRRIDAKKSKFTTLEEILSAAEAYVPATRTVAQEGEPIEIGTIINSAGVEYTVVFSDTRMALGYTPTQTTVGKAYKVFSTRTSKSK